MYGGAVRYSNGARNGGRTMSTFAEQRARFMTSSVPSYEHSQVEPIIGGPEYFRQVKALIETLGSGDTSNQFIYIAGWWLDPNFSLEGIGGGTRLTDLLIEKSRAGVDVRVLGWVMAPEVLQSPQLRGSPYAVSIFRVNGYTMRFIAALRSEDSMLHKACLNILSHPAGAVHIKMALIGDGHQTTGFTGGLDFVAGRHRSDWHDVQAKVTGRVTQSLFDAFRQMWNEVRSRPPAVGLTQPRLPLGGGATLPEYSCDSHTSSMPELSARSVPSTASTSMHVQSARTLPAFNISSLGSLAEMAGARIPSNRPLSYAANGLFEVKEIWRPAIGQARRYIYIEDQAFHSREVFDWINQAVRLNDDLHVILLIGLVDPNDTPSDAETKFIRIAVNNHLVKGLTPDQIDRIGLFSDRNKVIHSKTTLIDDVWAMAGSANSMRRSLYSDFEHSVSWMEESGVAVRDYRVSLWGTHLQRTVFDLDAALSAWFSLPYQGAANVDFTGIERVRLPMPQTTLTEEEEVLYDEVYDVDSRQAWGGRLVRHFTTSRGLRLLSP